MLVKHTSKMGMHRGKFCSKLVSGLSGHFLVCFYFVDTGDYANGRAFPLNCAAGKPWNIIHEQVSSRDHIPPRIYLSPRLSGTPLGFRSFSPYLCNCEAVRVFIKNKEEIPLKER